MTGTSYNGTLANRGSHDRGRGSRGHHSRCSQYVLLPLLPLATGSMRHPGGYMGEDIDVLYDFINSR